MITAQLTGVGAAVGERVGAGVGSAVGAWQQHDISVSSDIHQDAVYMYQKPFAFGVIPD